MQPNAPYPAPPPVPMPPIEKSPYDFIMKDPPKKSGFPGLGGNKKQLMFLAVIALVVMILILIIGSVVSNSGKSTTQTLIELAEEQTELVRVANVGTKKSRGAEAKSLATTTMLAVQTSQQDTVALLKKQGHKLNAKQLASKRSAKTDEALNTGDLNNTFDDAFMQVIQASLKTYQTDVKLAYDASTNKTEKAILAGSFNGINIILAGTTPTSTNTN